MRKLAIIFTLFLVLFQGFAIPTYAAETQKNPADSGVIGKQIDEYYSDEDNKPGLLERTISDAIISFSNFLIKAFGMQDVTLLVFGKNPNPTDDGFLQGGTTDTREGLYLGVFTEGMMLAIDTLYTTFEHFLPYPVVLALLLIAFLLLWHGGYSGEGRTKVKDYTTAFIVGILSIKFGLYMWNFVAKVVGYCTELIWSIMVDTGLNPGLFLNTVWGTGSAGYDNMVQYRGLVVAVLVLLAAFMTAKLNYAYTMRLINLMVLLSCFVICAILTIFPKYRNSLQTWWNEFISNMILPCAHALALGLFFLLLYFSSDGVSNWIIVAYLFGFSKIETLVQRLVGAEQADSKMGRALGLGTIFAMSRMFKGSKGHNSSKGKASNQDSMGNVDQAGQVGGSAGTIASGETGVNGMGSAPTSSSSPRSNWKSKIAKGGSKAAGFALNQGAKGVGAAVGASIGMMAGKPVEGALAGGWLGGGAGAATHKAGKFIGNLGQKSYAWIQERKGGNSHDIPNSSESFERNVPISSTGAGDSNSVANVGLYQEQETMKRTTPNQLEQPIKSQLTQGEVSQSILNTSANQLNAPINRVLNTNIEGQNPIQKNQSNPPVTKEQSGENEKVNNTLNNPAQPKNESTRPDAPPTNGGKHYNYHV
jgi:hypothetical protein